MAEWTLGIVHLAGMLQAGHLDSYYLGLCVGRIDCEFPELSGFSYGAKQSKLLEKIFQ